MLHFPKPIMGTLSTVDITKTFVLCKRTTEDILENTSIEVSAWLNDELPRPPAPISVSKRSAAPELRVYKASLCALKRNYG